MTALLVLDPHPFTPDPVDGWTPDSAWAERLWTAAGDDAVPTLGARLAGTGDELEALVSAVADLRESAGSVLLLYPAHRPAPARALLRTLHWAGLGPDAAVATAAPPLSTSVITLLLRGLAGRPDWDAGRLAAAAPVLAEEITTTGWVPRAGRPLRSRAGGPSRTGWTGWTALPSRGGYDVTVEPDGSLRLTRRPTPAPAPAPATANGMPTDGSPTADGPLTYRVSTDPGTAGPARRWFGTGRSRETVTLDPALLADRFAALEQRLHGRARVRRCEWCGSSTPSAGPAAAGCTSCHHRARTPGGVEAAGPVVAGR
jgi:hypothetical protein